MNKTMVIMYSPEQEPRHEQISLKEYEIKNKEGQFIARVKLEIVDDLTMLEDARWKRRLKKIELLNKDGEVIDIFSKLNIEAEVYLTSGFHASFFSDSFRVLIPELTSPERILTLLHELGHVKQRKEDWSEDQENLSYFARMMFNPVLSVMGFIGIEPKTWTLIAREFNRLLGIPDARRRLTISQKDLSNIQILVDTFVFVRQIRLNLLEKEGSTQEQINTAMQEQLSVLEKLKTYDKLIRDNLTELLRMEERDATVRALKWLREWKTIYGIDLLQDGAYEDLREGQSTYGIPLIRRPNVKENTTTCEEEENRFGKLVA